jgi:hypothetical protein
MLADRYRPIPVGQTPSLSESGSCIGLPDQYVPGRDEWWRFAMPGIPAVLVSSGFTQDRTKTVLNFIGARAVGSVCGIYGVPKGKRKALAQALRKVRLSDRIVAHSNGLRKLEINQINTIIAGLL